MLRPIVTVAVLAVFPADCLELRAQDRFPRQIQFFAEIVDVDGKPVAGVKPSDLRVVEDGVEGIVLRVEPIRWPVTVTLLIDNGRGVANALSELRTGLRALVNALPPDVEVSLVTTAPQPRRIVRATKDKGVLARGIDRITPDSGNARFVEALMETAASFQPAAESGFFPVVISLATSNVDGSEFSPRDYQQMMERLQRSSATVHVVMFETGSFNDGVGKQVEVGSSAAKATGGRYDAINTASRLATVLPEIGRQAAQAHDRQSHQYRITFDRPSSKPGPVGTIDMAGRPGWRGQISIDGRVR